MEETLIGRGMRAPEPGDRIPEKLDASRRGRSPVLFVPGFLRPHALTATLHRRLRGLDFEIYPMRPPLFGAGDLRRFAQTLRERMREMRILLGARKLSLIGQGTGGLAARYAVEQLGASEYLDRLLMLGTPNRGTCTFYLLPAFTAAREAVPSSAFLHALNEGYRAAAREGGAPNYISKIGRASCRERV